MLRSSVLVVSLAALAVGFADCLQIMTTKATATWRTRRRNIRPTHTSVVKMSGKENEHADNLEESGNGNTKDKKDRDMLDAPFLLDTFGLSSTSPVLPIITLLVAAMKPIPAGDVFFSIAYPAYLCFANRFRFDLNTPRLAAVDRNYKKLPLLREGRGPWLFKYVLTFGVVGIILPLLLVLIAATNAGAPASAAANAAAPHLYLTLCQCLMESLTKGPKFYHLTALMVPIGFNAYRLGCLKTWFVSARQSLAVAVAAQSKLGGRTLIVSSPWQTAGFLLALSNVVIWTYNLFVFLLLRTLPQYLDRTKFPDAIVSWKGQLIPVLHSSDTASAAAKEK